MQTKLSQSGLEDLELKLGKKIPQSLNDADLTKDLLAAAEPLRAQMVQEAPRGEGYERVSLARSARSNDYRRGGATRADIRTKAVKDNDGEVKVLVGVSQEKGKVGWRTAYIVLGVANVYRIPANPFLDRAYEKTKNEVETLYQQAVAERVEKALRG